MGEPAIEVRGLRKSFGDQGGGGRDRPGDRGRFPRRAGRAERGGEDHVPVDDDRPAAAGRRPGPDQRAGCVGRPAGRQGGHRGGAGRGPAVRAAERRGAAGVRRAAARPARRRGALAGRAAAGRARPDRGRQAAGRRLLHRHAQEGHARLRPDPQPVGAVPGRAARGRGSGLRRRDPPAADPLRRLRLDRAVLQPRHGAGRAGLRPRLHHRQGPDRGHRHHRPGPRAARPCSRRSSTWSARGRSDEEGLSWLGSSSS